ncbi:hypothetical protein C5S31_09810 [ANME-1 cluster archaeon GoMg2]|nr:hypothetical protein [ANME-1 cluster archaeon GoMg2]
MWITRGNERRTEGSIYDINVAYERVVRHCGAILMRHFKEEEIKSACLFGPPSVAIRIYAKNGITNYHIMRKWL